MSIFATSQTIVRYKVEKKDEGSILEFVRTALESNCMPEEKFQDETSDMVVGWVPLESPYVPKFDLYPFQYGSTFVFSLRIDKKKVPAKLAQQQMAIAIKKKLHEAGRDFLARSEKTELKETVMDSLIRRMPFVPSVYDLIWDYETHILTFLSNQKAANEILETIFMKSFERKLLRLFPYTMVTENMDLSAIDQEKLFEVEPSSFRI